MYQILREEHSLHTPEGECTRRNTSEPYAIWWIEEEWQHCMSGLDTSYLYPLCGHGGLALLRDIVKVLDPSTPPARIRGKYWVWVNRYVVGEYLTRKEAERVAKVVRAHLPGMAVLVEATGV